MRRNCLIHFSVNFCQRSSQRRHLGLLGSQPRRKFRQRSIDSIKKILFLLLRCSRSRQRRIDKLVTAVVRARTRSKVGGILGFLLTVAQDSELRIGSTQIWVNLTGLESHGVVIATSTGVELLD